MASRSNYELKVLLGAKKASSYDKNISSARSGIESVGKVATRAAAVVTAAFAAVNITGAISDAMDTYTDFEQEMANTAAIAGATSTEYEMLETAAREAGKSTTKTASESAAALGYMSLAGWDAKESVASLESVLKLSESTHLDLAETSDLVTDSMSAMKIGVGDLSEYLDLVAESNNAANHNAQQVMETFIRTGGAANALGADLQETAVAAGILANNGTKGAKAGTALNAIFSRLATNDNAKAALNELGISIFDAKGEFIGLEESMELIDDKLDDMSTKDATGYLKDIAGTQYFSKMQYLLDSVGDGANGTASAWDKLEKSLADSEGALEEMDKTVTGTTSGSIQRMQSALEDVKLSFGETFNDGYVMVIDELAMVFNDASEAITEFGEEHENEIHQFFEDFISGAEQVGETVSDIAGFVTDNWDTIETLIAGSGVAVAIFRIADSFLEGSRKAVAFASGVNKTAKSLGLLEAGLKITGGPVAIAIAALTAAVGGIAALKVHYDKTEKRLAKADLEKHFGNIDLSLEDLDEIAQKIVGKKQLTRISTMLESIGDTDESVRKLSEDMEKVSQVRWKVTAGLDISKDDKDKYVSAIDSYVQGAHEIIENKGYTVSVATDLLFGTNSKIGRDNDAFYAGLDNELSVLEKQLNKRVREAVNKGVDIETDKPIQKLLKKINKIMSALTEAENEAELKTIALKYSGKDLTSSDFKQLTLDIQEYTEHVQEGALEGFYTEDKNLERQKNMGKLSPKEYEKKVAAAEEAYYKVQAKAIGKGMDYVLQTMGEVYPEIKDTDVQGTLREKFDEAMAGGVEPGKMDSVINGVIDQLPEASKGIGEYYNESGIRDMLQDAKELYSQMGENNYDVPEALVAGITDTESMGALGGSTEDALSLLGESVSNSLEYKALLTMAQEGGVEVPEAFSEAFGSAVDDALPQMQKDADRLYNSILSDVNGKYEIVMNVDVTTDYVKGALGTDKAETEKKKGHSAKNLYGSEKAGPILHNAKGGIYYEPILTTFSEEGPEAAVPLDGSKRAKEIWMEAGGILGMFDKSSQGRVSGISSVNQRLAASSGDVALYQNLIQAEGAGSRSGGAPGQKIEIHYAPNITIQGNADGKVVSQAMWKSQQEFDKMMKQYEARQGRVLFGKV